MPGLSKILDLGGTADCNAERAALADLDLGCRGNIPRNEPQPACASFDGYASAGLSATRSACSGGSKPGYSSRVSRDRPCSTGQLTQSRPPYPSQLAPY